ncbi:conserved hypothetical protein [Aspergillus terreus NIH2624]|uniref:Glycosyltransferase family 25 protein n=1 Tax=Aspergillus terreus (strain NIH 2624 / FGSC A1156) TaxID=341663 RepID=Q0CY44_ASPTN|nr:uncharacterized protein ATEG_01390 [Aspergillus terreus NIH2624]EAU38147.1 conserved hypothetical protein [Aspergillus terreus NIH2624]
MLVSPRHLSFFGITAFLLFLIVSLHKWRPPSHSMASVPPHAPSPSPSPPDGNAATDINPVASAGNSTLGFQKILALSAGPSWRSRGLQAAAELTGLQIEIPAQPPINPDLVNAYQTMGPASVEHPTHGASIAWLAHLDLIKHVLQSNLDTALILEDDVDWDRALREQMVRTASAVRNLTHLPPHQESDAPYGRAWDVLWIGHCGEYWDEGVETVVFEDTGVCPHDKYFGWAGQYVSRLPDRKRAVYWSYNPVCSFAYGMTRAGARRVLEQVGGSQDESFDVAMMHACRQRRLDCISVVPEVVHQYFPAQKYGVQSLVDIGNGKEPGPADEVFESVMGSTENILESARCFALWGKTCLRS